MTDALFDIDTAAATDPGADPWAMRHGVPVDVLDTPDPASTPVDYLRLGQGVTRSREFRAFRRQVGPLALAWWAGLLIVARRDGVFGIVDIDDIELALEATGTPDHADDVPGVLEALQRAELVWVRQRDGVVTVRVRKWREWQVKSPRDRQRLARARGKAADEVIPNPSPHAEPRTVPVADAPSVEPVGHALPSPVTPPRDSHATALDVTTHDSDTTTTQPDSDPPAFAPALAREAAGIADGNEPRKKGRRIDPATEAALDRLAQLLPSSRRVFGALAQRGATEADFHAAREAITDPHGTEPIRNAGAVACAAIQRRIERRNNPRGDERP